MRYPWCNRFTGFAAFCAVALCLLTANTAGADVTSGVGDEPSDEQSSPTYSSPYPEPIADPYASPIACMKRLPDGAMVCVNRRCVSRANYDYYYIEEADRSAGIKVLVQDCYPMDAVERGNLISFLGMMDTVSGERVVRSKADFVVDTQAHAIIGALGMSSAAILGWPIDFHEPDGLRVLGLMPAGLLVKISGKVTAANYADEDGYFCYLDDGWGKKDNTDVGARGIRVYTNLIPGSNDHLTAIGVLGRKLYDPTPEGPSGDEYLIPAVLCSYDQDPYYPSAQPLSSPSGEVTGRVRLVGETAPGRTVRVYSQGCSVVLENVTSEYRPFTLTRIPTYDPTGRPPTLGGVVSAAADGYISDSRASAAGDTNVDFDLQPSSYSMEIKTDNKTIAICSQQQAVISALIRDCEGKGIEGRAIKLVTSRGAFSEGPEHPSWVILTTDATGFVTAHLTSADSSAGIAVVTATEEPGEAFSASVPVTFRGPDIVMTASPRYVSEAGNSAITATVTTNGAPIQSAPVTFKTDAGTFQESGSASYLTLADGYGTARATLVINQPGTAKVTATYSNSCGHKTVSWTVVAFKSNPWYTQGIQYSNPLIVDLDGKPDGKKEAVIVTTAGHLTALTASGAVSWSKATHLPGNNTPSCAVLDNERSGKPCVFVPAESQQKLFGFAYDGSPLAGWPAGANYRFIRVAASIGDVNLDGTPEIVAGDECCYVFAWNPTGDWKRAGTWDSSYVWHNLTASSSTTIYNTTCALGDLSGSLDPPTDLDVFCGSNHTTALFGFPGDAWGDYVSSPLYLDGFPKAAGGRVATSPAIGDIDGDGINDLAVGSDYGSLYVLSSRYQTWRGIPTGGMVKSSPAMGDLNGDGNLDAVIVGSDSGKLFAFDAQGQASPGWEGGIKLNTSGDYAIESSPILASVSGSSRPDVIVGCNDGSIYAVYADGVLHTENGEPTGPIAWARCCVPTSEATAQVVSSPVADDIDNDGKFEVLAGSDKGVYLFHFSSPYDPANHAQHPWPTFHADNARTGCATPMPPLVNASIVGVVTNAGLPVQDAKIYVYHQDGTPVYVPLSDPPVERSWVQTVGTATDPTELGKGAYCISRLEPNQTYKVRVDVPGSGTYWIENIAVTTGKVVADLTLP